MKTLLLTDNAPSHPPESDLKSEDGCTQAMFMPPNITPFNNQWIRILLGIGKEMDRLDAMKQFTLNESIHLLEAACERVGHETLAKCWKNILDIVDDDEPEYNIPLSNLRDRW